MALESTRFLPLSAFSTEARQMRQGPANMTKIVEAAIERNRRRGSHRVCLQVLV
jgi:hypothetical protein